MVSFTINLEVMSRVGVQQNKTGRGWYKMQGRDSTPVKINGSKTISPFFKVSNNEQTESSKTAAFRNILMCSTLI